MKSLLSVKTIKKLVTSRPGLTNSDLASHCQLGHSFIRCWFNRVHGNDMDWLFTQKVGGKNYYFTNTYAKKHNLIKIIRCPPPSNAREIARINERNKEVLTMRRYDKMWKVPKVTV